MYKVYIITILITIALYFIFRIQIYNIKDYFIGKKIEKIDQKIKSGNDSLVIRNIIIDYNRDKTEKLKLEIKKTKKNEIKIDSIVTNAYGKKLWKLYNNSSN